jgi:hypothetical protein
MADHTGQDLSSRELFRAHVNVILRSVTALGIVVLAASMAQLAYHSGRRLEVELTCRRFAASAINSTQWKTQHGKLKQLAGSDQANGVRFCRSQ